MSECLIYQLKPGKTEVGKLDSDKPAAICLSGESIAEEHCYFENTDGRVMLYALPDTVTACTSLHLYLTRRLEYSSSIVGKSLLVKGSSSGRDSESS